MGTPRAEIAEGFKYPYRSVLSDKVSIAHNVNPIGMM